MGNLYVAYGLIAAGLLMLAAELFIPSGGLLFVLAVLGVVGGVAMTFLASEDPTVGWLTLVGVFVIIPVGGRLLFNYWRKTVFARKLILPGPAEDDTVASMPVNLELEQLRGRLGRAVSALRPAGVVEFDGRRVDSLTEGMMVEPGTWVRCIDVRAGKVIVRATAGPDLNALENATFD